MILDNCQYSLDTIIQSRPILPKLLFIFHVSAGFIINFCVNLDFDELHMYFTHNLTVSIVYEIVLYVLFHFTPTDNCF